MGRAFAHIDTWIFDLDNTLYPPSVRLFDQIEEKMVAFVMRELRVSAPEADRLRAEYWAAHGTTLAGLIHHHDVEPMAFLDEVHDISFDAVPHDSDLAALIDALPGRKLVYTNGDKAYARKVLAARGLGDVLTELYGIEDASFHPKPQAAAYDRVLAKAGVAGPGAAFFEDDGRNLIEPHARGMRTVLVAPEAFAADHIHHHTDDLGAFLEQIAAEGFSAPLAASR